MLWDFGPVSVYSTACGLVEPVSYRSRFKNENMSTDHAEPRHYYRKLLLRIVELDEIGFTVCSLEACYLLIKCTHERDWGCHVFSRAFLLP